MIADLPQLWSDEERWQVLMENIKDYGIFMLDSTGHIATWNVGAQRLLKYGSEEIIGEPFELIFTPEDLQQDQPEFELREARDKGRCEDERWHVRKDGTQFWASGVVAPLWAPDGTLRGYAKILRDITERKLSEIAVSDANRRKDEFLAILAHEFRNPLAAICNAAQLLQMEPLSEDILPQAVEIIHRQAISLTHMVDDLMDVSRISSGKLQIQRQRVDLAQLLKRAFESAQPLVESRNHHLVVQAPNEAVWLDADPHRLQQVISNLVVNAAKYTDPGGSIWVTLVREGNQAVISVRDNGAGILSEMLPRIFEAFVQADRSLDRSQGGLGIGLSLVKRLVEMHGGTVEARSEGIGKGSEFIVRIPAIAEIETLNPKQATSLETVHRTGLRIVVAEDNDDTAQSMAMILRKFGHEVEIVSTGTEALRAASERQPNVMILDIGLPGMDGYRVAQAIRSQPELAGVTIIAVTGYGQSDDQDRAKEAGVDYHLVKPVDFAALLKLLDVS